MRQKLKTLLIACLLLVPGISFGYAGAVSAAAYVQPISTVAYTPDKAINGDCSSLNQCDLIVKYIQPFINLMAAFVGVAIVISVVVGGIQYGSSAGDPQKASAAKARIRNAIIALVAFVLLYAGLNFLIPGGLVL